MGIHAIPAITAEQENFRSEPMGPGYEHIQFVKRDPIEPVPVGTFIAYVFEVVGYDQDCDGSLMARLKHVDKNGQASGWEPDKLGLYPDSAVVVDDPKDLWQRVRT